MMTIPRSAIRAIRAVARKCVVGRPRGPAPPVQFLPGRRCVRAVVFLSEVILIRDIETDSPGSTPITVSLADLAAVEGTGDDPVSLRQVDAGAVQLQWSERAVPRQVAVASPEQRDTEPPNSPGKWRVVSREFLSAMHEAGRTTQRDPTRFALNRIQLQGRHGAVVATDGRMAYLHDGFSLPFSDDILIPAVPVFGSRELDMEDDVRIARSETHFVVNVGSWTMFLAIDKEGKFPDVRSIIPRMPTPTTWTLDDADARRILDTVPQLPGAQDDDQPITLDLVPGESGIIRAQDATTPQPVELRLDASTIVNGPSRLALNRTWLYRAISLGCRTVKIIGVTKPIVATGGSTTLLILALDKSCIVEPSESTIPCSVSTPSTVSPRRIREVKAPDLNGSSHSRDEPPDNPDALAEAEAMKAALSEAAYRAGRLVQLLKQSRKEKRVLQSAWSALRALNLGTGDRP